MLLVVTHATKSDETFFFFWRGGWEGVEVHNLLSEFYVDVWWSAEYSIEEVMLKIY